MRKVVTVAILAVAMAVVVALNWDVLTSEPNSTRAPVASDRTATSENKPLPLPTVSSTETSSTTSTTSTFSSAASSTAAEEANEPIQQPVVETVEKQPAQASPAPPPTQVQKSANEPSALGKAKQAAARFAAAASDNAPTTKPPSTGQAIADVQVSPSVSQQPRTEASRREPLRLTKTPATAESKALSALEKAKRAASSFAEAVAQSTHDKRGVTATDTTSGVVGADALPKQVLAQALSELPKASIEKLPKATVTQIAEAVSAQTGSEVGSSSGTLTPFEKVASAPRAQLERLPQDLLVQAVSSLPMTQLEQLSPDLERTVPAALDTARTEVQIDAEARRYIRDLTSARLSPILASNADHFVGGNQRLTIAPLEAVRTTSLAELSNSDSVDPNTPLTIVRVSEKLVPLKAEEFTTSSASQLAKPIRIVLSKKIVEIPVHEALTKLATSEEPIQVVETVRRLEATTLAKLTAEGLLTPRQKIKVLTRTAEGREQRINDLIDKLKAQRPGSIFYVRTVQATDVQGIWGIIQSGLIDNFARGMAVRRGESVDRYKVNIPRDADELLADASSSFLGRLIHSKTSASTVVNVDEGRIVADPNFIQPGQQIVIVDFSGAELVAIYRHFSRLSQRANATSG